MGSHTLSLLICSWILTGTIVCIMLARGGHANTVECGRQTLPSLIICSWILSVKTSCILLAREDMLTLYQGRTSLIVSWGSQTLPFLIFCSNLVKISCIILAREDMLDSTELWGSQTLIVCSLILSVTISCKVFAMEDC